MPPGLADDRFDQAWEHDLRQARELFVAAGLPREDGDLTAFVGGIIAGGQLHLDALVDSDHHNPIAAIAELLTLLSDELSRTDDSRADDTDVFVWAKPSFDWHDDLADLSPSHLIAKSGPRFEPHRALHQMRAPMADVLAGGEPLLTRAFVPGSDDEALRLLNNRAFAQHPDQGGQSATRFQSGLDQGWVQPEGIRLYEVNNELAGFCWTRIHQQPPLGEIYVIGVDPAFHGQGLGGPMTAAGLYWLSQQGLDTAMLYVEANNQPALATYERLGFHITRTDRSWRWLKPRSGNQSST